jgi:hypothetical protein
MNEGLDSYQGIAEQAAEKLTRRPTADLGAKAPTNVAAPTARLKAAPFQKMGKNRVFRSLLSNAVSRAAFRRLQALGLALANSG